MPLSNKCFAKSKFFSKPSSMCMRVIFILITAILFLLNVNAQNVGIGTATPNAKAVLDITSTDKGVLFPRLTTAQRNAISNPPDGLHIFNTDERCLNYYDANNSAWNCYCSDCRTVTIRITTSTCKLDFYNSYAKNNPASSYVIRIESGVTISGCAPGDTALSFSNMLNNANITILNYGTIAGAGGNGGMAAIESGCQASQLPFPLPGNGGGHAVSSKTGVQITINNYGIVSGGGGGGGGSSKGTSSGQGGGGGGGAGIIAGTGGTGGGFYQAGSTGPPFNLPTCTVVITAQPGGAGQVTNGGPGGAGFNGGPAGGNGGARGQAGQNGPTGAAGGAAGKAIAGGNGNVLNNISGGQSFGGVD